jgi:hypothetical protein
MCNSILISPWTVSAVGPPVPVVLRRIWARAGGTPRLGPVGPAWAGRCCPRIGNPEWSHRSHPSVLPKDCRTACSTTGTTGPTRYCPVSGMKNVFHQ